MVKSFNKYCIFWCYALPLLSTSLPCSAASFPQLSRALLTVYCSGADGIFPYLDFCELSYFFHTQLRKWATKTTQRLTRVSSDDYDMIKDAIQWMVGVITLNMFDNDILLVDEHDVSTSAAYLPTHLCDLKCPLEFWKGFTKLLLRLEGDVLCYKVLGVSGYRDLPDTILNAIENKGDFILKFKNDM